MLDEPAPVLPEGFSVEFNDFLAICLRKKGSTRPSAATLLAHPFVKKFTGIDKAFLSRWIKAL